MGIIRRCVVVLAIVFGICACDQHALLNKIAPHPATEVGQSVIDSWRTGKIDELRPMLSAELGKPDVSGIILDSAEPAKRTDRRILPGAWRFHFSPLAR